MSVSLSTDGKWVVGDGGPSVLAGSSIPLINDGVSTPNGIAFCRIDNIEQAQELTNSSVDPVVDFTLVIMQDQLPVYFAGHVANDILDLLAPTSQ